MELSIIVHLVVIGVSYLIMIFVRNVYIATLGCLVGLSYSAEMGIIMFGERIEYFYIVIMPLSVIIAFACWKIRTKRLINDL